MAKTKKNTETKLTDEQELDVLKDELFEHTWMSHDGKRMWWTDITSEDESECGKDKITYDVQEYYLDLVARLYKSMERLCDNGAIPTPKCGIYYAFLGRIEIDMEFVDREHAAGKGSYMDIMNFVCAKLVRLKAEMDSRYVFKKATRDEYFTMDDPMSADGIINKTKSN